MFFGFASTVTFRFGLLLFGSFDLENGFADLSDGLPIAQIGDAECNERDYPGDHIAIVDDLEDDAREAGTHHLCE